MRLFPAFILLLLACNDTWATAQMAELIEYDGKDLSLMSTPLDPYLQDHPEAQELMRRQPNNSALWRGYIGHWKIDEENRLILKEVHYLSPDRHLSTVPFDETKSFSAARIFGPKTTWPVTADWYTGDLRIIDGERLEYVHFGFASRFQTEIYLRVKNGKVIDKAKVVYDPEKHAFRSHADLQWTAFDDRAKSNFTDDPTTWTDARLLSPAYAKAPLASDKVLRTRGFYSPRYESFYPEMLNIPPTEKSEYLNLPITQMPDAQIEAGPAVEVEARVVEKRAQPALEILSIRDLPRGASIHHPDFPELEKTLTQNPQVHILAEVLEIKSNALHDPTDIGDGSYDKATLKILEPSEYADKRIDIFVTPSSETYSFNEWQKGQKERFTIYQDLLERHWDEAEPLFEDHLQNRRKE